jgi:hypothetical protein
MIGKLKLTVAMRATETATSFMSRLGAANGVGSLPYFCRILGLHPLKLVLGDDETIEAAALYGGVSPHALKEYAVTKTRSEVRVGRFNTGKHMLSNEVRFCPRCVAEDLAGPADFPESRPSIRAAWRVRWADRCPVHGVLLEDRAEASGVYGDDFCAFVRDHRLEIINLANDAKTVELHPFDFYIEDRVRGEGTGTPFLGSLGPHVSAEICEAVGAVDLHPYDAPLRLLDRTQLTVACRRGFEIVSEGEEAIFEYFAKRIASVDGDAFGRNPVYGPLYRCLQYRLKKPEYGAVIARLREQAIRLMALGPGDNFLGPVEHRVTHSLYTASKELGLHPKRLKKLLASHDLLPDNHGSLSDGRLVVPADLAIELLGRDAKSVGARELKKLSGLTPDKVEELIAKGVPIAKSGTGEGDELYVRYYEPDVTAFLDRIYPKLATTKLKGGYVTLRSASSSIGVTIAGLLAMIYHDDIKDVVRIGRVRKPSALRVNQKEVWNWRASKTAIGYSATQVAKLLRTNDRSLWFIVKVGLLRSTVQRNPITRQQQHYFSPQDVAEFKSTFISLWELAQVRKTKIGTLRPELESRGIFPVVEPPPKLARYYRRSEVLPI